VIFATTLVEPVFFADKTTLIVLFADFFTVYFLLDTVTIFLLPDVNLTANPFGAFFTVNLIVLVFPFVMLTDLLDNVKEVVVFALACGVTGATVNTIAVVKT